MYTYSEVNTNCRNKAARQKSVVFKANEEASLADATISY